MTDVNYEHIERYLAGDMTDKERRLFEEDLIHNDELSSQLRFYIYVNDNIAEHLYSDHRNTLQITKKKAIFSPQLSSTVTRPNINIMSNIRWFAFLAFFTIAMVAITIWASQKPTLKEETSKITMQEANPEGLPVSAKNGLIIQLFNEQKFEEALPLLNIALEENPEDTYIRYYRGITFLNLNNLGAARRDLLQVYTESSSFLDQSAYYIALSYLEEEDDYVSSAIKWLDKISAQSALYQKAQELRQRL